MYGSQLIGSHLVLSLLPIWVTLAILYVINAGILFEGRDFFEGLGYNIARSSVHGNVGLVVCMLIAADILQRQPIGPWWLESGAFHWLAAGIALYTGFAVEIIVLANSKWKLGQWMDVYHNTFIVPVFTYLMLTLLPVTYYNGTQLEIIVSFWLVVFWSILGIHDAQTGRLNQRDWLAEQGVYL